jgi:hypothetical protein
MGMSFTIPGKKYGNGWAMTRRSGVICITSIRTIRSHILIRPGVMIARNILLKELQEGACQANFAIQEVKTGGRA